MSGITPKQQRFVDEYLIDLNATRAYREVYGAKQKVAEANGARLLGNAKVAKIIAEKQQAQSDAIEITQEYVLSNLTEILERCMQRAPVMEFDKEKKVYVQATDEDGKAIWTFDAKNALGAVHLLGKHRGMFGDKLMIDDLREVSKLSDEELEQRRRKLKLVA